MRQSPFGDLPSRNISSYGTSVRSFTFRRGKMCPLFYTYEPKQIINMCNIWIIGIKSLTRQSQVSSAFIRLLPVTIATHFVWLPVHYVSACTGSVWWMWCTQGKKWRTGWKEVGRDWNEKKEENYTKRQMKKMLSSSAEKLHDSVVQCCFELRRPAVLTLDSSLYLTDLLCARTWSRVWWAWGGILTVCQRMIVCSPMWLTCTWTVKLWQH